MAKRKMGKAAPKAETVTESTGNVFGDLGFPNPEQELMKARLTLEIYRIIGKRELTQVEAARVLGIKQPHVSLLMRNRGQLFGGAVDGVPDRTGAGCRDHGEAITGRAWGDVCGDPLKDFERTSTKERGVHHTDGVRSEIGDVNCASPVRSQCRAGKPRP